MPKEERDTNVVRFDPGYARWLRRRRWEESVLNRQHGVVRWTVMDRTMRPGVLKDILGIPDIGGLRRQRRPSVNSVHIESPDDSVS